MKKPIGAGLAALIAASLSFTGAFALEAPTKEDHDAAGAQKIYFQFPDDGTWGDPDKATSRNVFCDVVAVCGNEYKFFTAESETKVCRCTLEDEVNHIFSYDLNTVSSYKLTNSGGRTATVSLYRFIENNPNADYQVSFSTTANGGYCTAPVNMTVDCVGDTLCLSSPVATRQNSQNSQMSDYFACWKNHPDYKTAAGITSTAEYLAGQIPPHTPPEKLLSDKLAVCLTSMIYNNYFGKSESNAKLCQSLGTTAQKVYDRYVSDYSEYMNSEEPNPADDSHATDYYFYRETDAYGNSLTRSIPTPEAVKAALGLTEGDDPAVTGDLNGDGKVTIEDATELQKYLAHRVEFSDSQKAAADTKGDGRISIDDVTAIQKFLAKRLRVLG